MKIMKHLQGFKLIVIFLFVVFILFLNFNVSAQKIDYIEVMHNSCFLLKQELFQ
jgi:hypothetical protein